MVLRKKAVVAQIQSFVCAAAVMVYFIFPIAFICVSLGMKMTIKRQQVCREFFQLADPIDAESFWLHLVNGGIKISRAQVYNILNLLASQGSANRIFDVDAKLHYFKPQVD